jgi:hypothetical protein
LSVLHDPRDRIDAGSSRKLLDLRELVVVIRSLRQDREHQAALRLGRT